MGGLRFLPLLAFAACANISGLDGLVVSDGAVAQTDATQDASDDAIDDEAAAVDSPPPPPPDGAATFCESQTQSYTWCADFDEADVTKGFLNGVVASWTSTIGQLPSLSAQFASPPASAHFEGGNKSSLTFSHAPTSLSLEVTGQLRINGTALTGDAGVFVVQLTPSYGIKLVATAGGIQSYSLSFNEVTTATDGGTQITPHPIGSYTLGTWNYVDVTISVNTVNITVGSNKAVSFGHTAQGTQSISTTFTVDTASWNGSWDSIRASF